MMDDYNLFRQQVDKVLSQQKAMRLQLRNGQYSTTCTYFFIYTGLCRL